MADNISIKDADGVSKTVRTTDASGVHTPHQNPQLYNGSTWDGQRGNQVFQLLASAARTANTASSLQTNYNARGVIVYLRVTAVSGSGGLDIRIREKDPVSGEMFDLLAGSAVTATGYYGYELYPGASGTGGNVVQRVSGSLPRDWDVVIVHSDGSSYTYSVGAALVV